MLPSRWCDVALPPPEPSVSERAAAVALKGMTVLSLLVTGAGLAGSLLGFSTDRAAWLVWAGLVILCVAPLVSLVGLGIVVFRRDPRAASFALAAVILTLLGVLAAS
jgi:hypothetical protein